MTGAGSLDWLFSSGRIVDIAIAALVLETAALLFWRGAGRVRIGLTVYNALAGLCLLLALRAALAGGSL